MRAKKSKKKEEHKSAFESSEVLAEQISKTEEYLVKYKIPVTIILGALMLAVSSVFIYRYINKNKNETAKTDMIQAVYYFESDSLDLALNGDGNNLGFLEIIDEYGNTETGNLANFYAGSIYLKSGNFNRAITYLNEFSTNDILIQARAYSLVGDAYMELANYDNAADYYTNAADYNPNKYFTPTYLLKAALAYEKLSDLQKAKEMYQKIVDDFFDSNEVQKAKKHLARLEVLLSS